MHHQLEQELRATQHAIITGPVLEIRSRIGRLRSVDMHREIPEIEFQRLELAASIREADESEARRLWQQLIFRAPEGLGPLLDRLERCAQGSQPWMQALLLDLRVELQRASTPPPVAGTLGRGSRRLLVAGVSAVFAFLVIGLVSWRVGWIDGMLPEGWRVGDGGTPIIPSTTPVAADAPDGVLSIADLKRQIVMVVNEARILNADGTDRWVPIGVGTAFPVTSSIYMTNRHVVEASPEDLEEAESLWSSIIQNNIDIAETRVIVVGQFGLGVTCEKPASVAFVAQRNKNDDLALIEVLGANAEPLRFAKVPTTLSRVVAVGYPGVSQEISNSLGSTDGNLAKVRQLFGDGLEPDGSLDLVRFFGDYSKEPTSTSGEVTKEEVESGIVQHNAIIAHGNSGGPLLDAFGRVVGLNTWGFGDDVSSFGASIRSERIKAIVLDSAFHSQIDWGTTP